MTILVAVSEPGNAVLLLNGDQTWESGYAWDYLGVAPPDFGGFGEGYTGVGMILGMRVYLTNLSPIDGVGDAFIYDSDGTNPGNVLSVSTNIVIEGEAIWPEVGIWDLSVVPTPVDGEFFVYLWGNWPAGQLAWYVAADQDGPPGRPRTNVAESSGYPAGWQPPPEYIWGETSAMGVGAWLEEGSTPAKSMTWGRVKALLAR